MISNPPCFAKQNATALAGAEDLASLFFRRKNPILRSKIYPLNEERI